MGIYSFKLPDVGEGMHEGEIVKWLVKSGEKITEDQVIVEVQNDKSVVELPSPVNGTVKNILIAEGTVATVGDILATFEVAGASEPDAATKTQPPAQLNQQASQPNQQAAQQNQPPAQQADISLHDVLAPPGIRKRAREMGIQLAEVTGTGKHGQVTQQDLEGFAEKGQITTETIPSIQANERVEERQPLRGIRKLIAEAMVKSVYTAPHVTVMDEVDVSKLVELREMAKPLAEKKGVKLTYLPFMVKILVAAVQQFPMLNASLDDEHNEIVMKKYYHIGIATDTDHGLMVPVIHDADHKNIWKIAAEIKELAAKAREGKLAVHEMKGSTITITNIGSAGGMFFTPVINYPEAAILGIGRIAEKPMVKNGQIVVGQLMSLSLSFDHRIIDGATAQHAVNYMKQLLENPELLIMEV